MQKLDCKINEKYGKIEVCEAGTLKNNLGVISFMLNLKGLVYPEILNISHYKKNNQEYEEFTKHHSPTGPQKFCEIMAGKSTDAGLAYIISICYKIFN